MNLDKLEIEITSNTKNATDGINQQIKALDNLKKTASGMKTPNTKITVDSKDVDKATQRVSKLTELLGSMKRIAMYRAVRSAIKAVTEAIKEGLENAYAYSKLVNGNLAKSLDRLTSKTAKFKNQLGAAFGEVIEAFEPILSELLDELTEIAKTLTSLFAMVGSALRTVYTLLKPVIDFALDMLKAIMTALRAIFDYIGQMLGSDGYLVANDISKSWDEATKSAKEYKRTLIGIDEINRLNDEPDVGEMFHIEPFDTPQNPYSDDNNPFAWVKALPNDFKAAGEAFDEFDKKVKPYNNPSGGAPGVSVNINVLADNAFKIISEFMKVLNGIPQTVPISIKVAIPNILTKMAEIFSKIMAYDPIAIAVKFAVANPIPALQEIWAHAAEIFSAAIPLSFFIANPIPQLQDIVTQIMAFTPMVIEIMVQMFDTEAVKSALMDVARVAAIVAAALGVGSLLAAAGTSIATGGLVASSVSGTAAISGAYIGMATAVSGALLDVKLAIAESTADSSALLAWWASDIEAITGRVDSAFAALEASFCGHIDSMQQRLEGFMQSINQMPLLTDGGRSSQKLLGGSTVGNALRTTGNGIAGAFGSVANGIDKIQSVFVDMSQLLGVRAYANGGYVDNGELFLARENGAEMVGTIGGHTGVANNEQITEGIAEGVAYANTAVVGAINQLIAVVQQIDPNVQIDGLSLTRSLHKYNRQVNNEYGSPLAVEVGV